MPTQTETSGVNAELQAISDGFVSTCRNDPYIASFGVLLNYSPASIAALDEYLREMYGTAGAAPGDQPYQLPEGKFPTVLWFGAYLGEVLRRIVGGSWSKDQEHPEHILNAKLQLHGGDFVKPFMCVYLRFKNGADDDLFPALLCILTHMVPEKLPELSKSFCAQADHFERFSQLPPERKAELSHLFRTLADGVATAKLGSADYEPKCSGASQPQPVTSAVAPALFELEQNVAEAESAVEQLRYAPAELATEDPDTVARRIKQQSIERAIERTGQRMRNQERTKKRQSFLQGAAMLCAAAIACSWLTESYKPLFFGTGFLSVLYLFARSGWRDE